MRKLSFLMVVLAVIFAGYLGASQQKVESEQKFEAVTGENASTVDYAFDKDSFAFGFTAYGAKDKACVITGITFKDFTVDSPDNKLEGTTLEVKLGSVDKKTSLKDL